MNGWLSRGLPLSFLFISMILGLVAIKKCNSRPVIIMGLLTAFVFAYELTGHFLGYHRVNNLWLYNFAWLIWVAGICFYYFNVLRTLSFKKAVIVLTAAYLALNIPLSFLYTFRSAELNTPGITISSVLTIVYSLFYLVEQNRIESTEPLSRNPYYFFCIGFILYFSVIIFMNSMYNFLLKNYMSDGLNRFIIYLPVAASFFYNLFISLGFICCLRNTKYT